jgi:hypothetical protein
MLSLDFQQLLDIAFDLVNSLIPVYYIPIGLGLAFSIIAAIVMAFRGAFK